MVRKSLGIPPREEVRQDTCKVGSGVQFSKAGHTTSNSGRIS